MKPAPFEYVAPESLDEAVDCLQRFGEDAKVLAGGQSLIPLMALRLARPTALVDLKRVGELRYITEDETLSVGAMTTHREIEDNGFIERRCPLIADAMRQLGHVAIRNRGTVAGSIAHADPAAEWPAIALALDAEVEVTGPEGNRSVPARDLFFSYFTVNLEPDEVIREVRFSMPPEGSGSAFLELARRHGDFGIAGVAAVVTADAGKVSAARLALMGVASTPVRVQEAEAILAGNVPSEEVVEEVTAAVNEVIEPVGDVHGSAEFRRNVARVLTKRAIEKAWERAGNGDRRG